MGLADIYHCTSGWQTIAVTTADQPILYVPAPATRRLWIAGIHMKVGSTAAAAGFDVRFRLCHVSNTPSGGTAPAIVPRDYNAPASLVTGALSGPTSGAWTTAPTAGSEHYSFSLHQVSGDAWPDYFPEGLEALAGATTNAIAVFVTLGVATSTPVACDLTWSE